VDTIVGQAASLPKRTNAFLRLHAQSDGRNQAHSSDWLSNVIAEFDRTELTPVGHDLSGPRLSSTTMSVVASWQLAQHPLRQLRPRDRPRMILHSAHTQRGISPDGLV
jgi:hypothetical protein